MADNPGKLSLFRKIDRAKYRYLEGRPPAPVRVISAVCALLLLAPVMHGLLITLLAENKEAIQTLARWSSPWTAWVKQHAPVMRSVQEDLRASGYHHKLPLAEYTYSMAILYMLLSAVAFFLVRAAERFYMQKSDAVLLYYHRHSDKRVVINSILKMGKGAITRWAIVKDLLLMITGLLFSWAAIALFYLTGFQHESVSRSSRLDKYFVFQNTDWAALYVLIMYPFFTLMAVFVTLLAAPAFKIGYVNFRPGRKRTVIIGG